MKQYSTLIMILLLASVPFQQTVAAQQATFHVVDLEELRTCLAARNEARSENVKEVQRLLRHTVVQKHLGRLLDLEQIAKAVPTLDEETLRQLAGWSREVNNQFRGGLGKGAQIAIGVGVVVAVVLIVMAIRCRGGCSLGRPLGN